MDAPLSVGGGSVGAVVKIGVVIPAYDAERYVADCLDSLLAQTQGNFVAYVMDDGSRDGTRAAIESYARRDPRIRLWHQENRGLVRTLNALLDRLDDDIEAVAFLDIDDFIHPEMFAVLEDALVRSGADVAECRVVRVAATDHPDVWAARPSPSSDYEEVDPSCYWLKRTSPSGWINKQNKLYRRAAIGNLRFRTTLSYEDDNFFASELNAQIRRKVRLAAELYAYRRNPSSATSVVPFRKYVGATLERIRLSCEVFLNAGRVPPAVRAEYVDDLSKDAYRMCLRKNLKKNADASERRALFLSAGAALARLAREEDFSPTGLNLVQSLVWTASRRGWYALARLLVWLT